MPNSNSWSIASAPCLLEWQRSRSVLGALSALTLLGAMSVLASEMPRLLAMPLSLATLGYGAWLVRAEARQPRRQVVWPSEGPVILDGVPIDAASLQWRGPLAFLRWRGREGRWHRLVWWPDTLTPWARRELRLAVDRRDASRRAPQMAR